MLRRFACAFGVIGFIAACSSEEEPEPLTVGVNDVVKACGIKSGWTRTNAAECQNCTGFSVVPECDCSKGQTYAGKCAQQQEARRVEPSCAGVGECVFACQKDCACVEACYANKDACRQKAAAVEGCVAEVCNASCQ